MGKGLSSCYQDNIYALIIAIVCNTNADRAFRLYYNRKKNKKQQFTPEEQMHMKKLYEKQVPVLTIAALYGVSAPTIYATLSKSNKQSIQNNKTAREPQELGQAM